MPGGGYLILKTENVTHKEIKNIDERRPQTRIDEISYEMTTRDGQLLEVTRDASQKSAPYSSPTKLPNG